MGEESKRDEEPLIGYMIVQNILHRPVRTSITRDRPWPWRSLW